MPHLLDYLDYRLYLRDFYEERKKENAYFSYRYMGKKTGLDAGYVVKILQGKLHIPERCIDGFCALCKFTGKEGAFFRTLINFNKAKSENQVKFHFEKLLNYKTLGKERLEEFQYEFYHKWYYSAIRSLIGIISFSGDYESLASLLTPRVSVPDVKKAVALLEKLKLVSKDRSGVYELCDTFVTTGGSWQSLAIKDFQRETIRLAAESLDRHKKDERDISTVTVAINRKDLYELKERISEFRDSILKFVGDSEGPDGVFQLNVQLFPVAYNQEEQP
jgi:uncharacterized protein (TIGR02147 family)